MIKHVKYFTYFILIFAFFNACNSSKIKIDGFDNDTNQKLNEFFNKTSEYKERKVAVFDGDGTVLGQTPHYLADECLYQMAAQNPDKKPQVIKEMIKQSNVSLPYVQNRIFFFEGDSLEDIRDAGVKCFNKDYSNKIFEPMRDLIKILKKNDFEVWIVTASPEALYQKFLSIQFNIPITNIIGVKSVIHGSKITNRIIQPVPQDHGKKEAIESFVQARPLLVGGNSRGDKEMIEYASHLKLIVNPDEHVAPDQDMSIADYAKKNGWLIVKIPDVPAENFPSISSKKFNIRLNKTHK